tara:strand:- start:26444 stop:26995 length:552 start_codon:yes stop_codon:yes gene_type:complete
MKKSKTLLAMVAIAALGGCSSSGSIKNEDGETVYANVNSGKVNGASTEQAGVSLSKAERMTANQEEQLIENEHQTTEMKSVVYFDYDTSALSEAMIDVIKAHADHLIKSGKSVTLHGHTDGRGTQEYNIALGERRGNAVKTYLMNEGVSSSAINVVSFGEEKPVAQGTSEFDYAQNRRVEFKY